MPIHWHLGPSKELLELMIGLFLDKNVLKVKKVNK